MAYKHNLAIIHNALANPSAYQKSMVISAIEPTVANLVRERKAIKVEMASIVGEIDQL